MQFVSGLPATGVLPASQREGPAELAKPSPARVIPAISQPVLSSAIVQTHPSERSAASFRKRANLAPGQKDFLTGPPPAFAINLLQYIRETRNDPEPLFPPDSLRPARTELTGTNPRNDASAPAAHGIADAQTSLGAPEAPLQLQPVMAAAAETTPRDWRGHAGDAPPTRQLDLAL